MHKLKYLTISIILIIMSLSLAGPVFNVFARPLTAISPTLGAVASYSVLAGSIVTNTGATTMPGDLGISPSIGVPPHYTGFPPGVVGPPGEIHDADAHAAAAQADNTAAFGFLDQNCDVTYAGVQDLTLVSPLGPGVYCADAFLLTGNLTLSGSGVWIFKSAATLTTSSNSSVTGGDPCNVWWRLVSSGTLGTGTTFIGNILALTDINLQTNASLNGRALAQTGQVTHGHSNSDQYARCTNEHIDGDHHTRRANQHTDGDHHARSANQHTDGNHHARRPNGDAFADCHFFAGYWRCTHTKRCFPLDSGNRRLRWSHGFSFRLSCRPQDISTEAITLLLYELSACSFAAV
jgi:hypothetical protein